MMFGFLKDRLKSAISNFSKKVKEVVSEEEVPKKETKKAKPKKKEVSKKAKQRKEVKEQIQETPKEITKQPEIEKPEEKTEQEQKIEESKEKLIEQQKEKKGFFSKLFGKKEKEAEKLEVEKKQEEPEEKKGILTKITEAVTKTSLSEEKFNDLFWDLEVILMENNVAVEVIEKIKDDMKKTLVEGKISRFNVDETILNTLKQSIDQILTFKSIDLLKEADRKKPLIIAFIGVNGSGKTTAIAKLTNYFQKHKKTVVLAAADTFRAAAIQQLEEHAKKLNTKIIKHDYGSDAAAVAFDAVKYAESNGIDVVMIDTAGRLHSNVNLMDEMKKIIRVAHPDLKIFVGESITGNDCVEQAEEFDKAVGMDGIILTKADVDEKGGAAISVSYVTKKPILFLGTGQGYDDFKPFDKKEIIKTLGL